MIALKSWVRRFFCEPVDQSYIETHEMLLRSARRCAYDLRHAVDEIARLSRRAGDAADGGLLAMFRGRSQTWVALFSSGNAMKDYRLALEREISKRDAEIERLRRLCEAHGVDHEGPTGVPF